MIFAAHLRNVAISCRHVALAAMVLLSSVPLHAEVTESLEYRYYTVEPRWFESLAASVLRASPVRENGKPFMGITAWTVEWDIELETSGSGQCAIRRVRTHLHSEITLPQVALEAPSKQERFDRFLEALRGHELDHVDITREAAKAIDKRLQHLPPMPNCDVLQAAADAVGQELLDEARQHSVQFDLDTGHGKTQGAVLN